MRSSPLHLCPSFSHVLAHIHTHRHVHLALSLSTLAIDSFPINYLFQQLNYLTQFSADLALFIAPAFLFSLLLRIDRCSWTLVKLLGQWENFNTEILSWEIAKTLQLLHYTTLQLLLLLVIIVNLLFFKEDLILFLIRHQFYYMRNKWSIKIFTKKKKYPCLF